MATLNTRVAASYSDHIMAFLEKRFIEYLKANLVLAGLGMKKVLPAHVGSTCKWNQWNALAADVTALTDGVSPDGKTPTSNNYTATVYAYGAYIAVSDALQLFAINDTLKDSQELLSYMASLTLDTLIRNEIDANGTQRYADHANNSSKANVESGSDKMSSDELKYVLKMLRLSNVRPFDGGIYKGIIHPYMEFDLLAETAASSFIVMSATNGTGSKVIEQAEIGRAFGIDLYRSTNVRADAASTNTYGNIFLGKDAFGEVDVESAQLKMIVKPHGSSGVEDPLDQRATVGYKMYFAVKTLEAVRSQILWAYGA